jgi:hypothetical protein
MTRFTRRSLLTVALAAPFLARATITQAQSTGDAMRRRCRFADQDFTYLPMDNPTTRDLVSLLPVALTIEDFSTNEKRAHLPRITPTAAT